MPYRIDVRGTYDDALDRLIDLGALDLEVSGDGAAAALMPDSVTPEQLRQALGDRQIAISPATGRDAGSVWVLSPRSIQVGRIRIDPARRAAGPGAIRLTDGPAFGTGLHPTTILCLEALTGIVESASPEAVLDVGTGSGVLALAALRLGVPRAVGIDMDADALRVAAENARLNELDDRLRLARGGPETLTAMWPLVLANVLAAPLIEMAPSLVQRVAHHGRLVLSGIPRSVEQDVAHAYRRLGMHHLETKSRDGWIALVLQASW